MKSIKSNLKLRFDIDAKKNGNQSIQITSLNDFLNNRDLSTLTEFKKKLHLNVKNREILNFKVFIIMDFDEKEYTEEIKNNYLNKSMFKNHFLYDYIVPIYNYKNFDEIMIDAGYDIDTSKKASSYRKIFPGKNGDFNEFLEIKRNISKVSSTKTNIMVLLDYLEEQYNKKEKY